jgi:hypothetical protein
VCQRLGARKCETAGFDAGLVLRLARQPVWLLGMASMILGFAFQASALRFGPLALLQPTLALELCFVGWPGTGPGLFILPRRGAQDGSDPSDARRSF